MCFSMRILYMDWSKVYDHEGFSSLFYCIGVIISELNCDFIILWFSASPWILKNLFFEGEASLKGIVVLFFFLSFIFFTFLFLVIQYIYIYIYINYFWYIIWTRHSLGCVHRFRAAEGNSLQVSMWLELSYWNIWKIQVVLSIA